MATQTPTTAELTASIIAALEAQLGQSVPLLPKAFLRVLAKVLAATFITLYKYVGYIGLQLFVETAGASDTTINGVTVNPLTSWGRLIGIGDPLPATAAEFDVAVLVRNQTGTLPAGSQLVGKTNGVTYITVGDVALNNSVKYVPVRAVADPNGSQGVGAIGNLAAGAAIDFVNPIANVDRTATVYTTIITTGADAETTAAYRQRVLDRFQRRPQGGAYADYAIWGESVAGVSRIYPYTGDPGQVNVYVDAGGVPTRDQLDAVAAAIELDDDGLASRRPVGALVNVLPVTQTGFDVYVTGLSDNTLQADITAAAGQYFAQARPYITGLDIPPRLDRLAQLELQAVVNDLVQAAGATFGSAYFTLAGNPDPILVRSLGEGEVATVSAVNYS